MFNEVLFRTLTIVVLCATIAGCAGTRATTYTGLAASQYLEPTRTDRSGRSPYSYSRHTDWSRYQGAIIDPVVIYRGDDNQFGNMTEEEKDDLANYMHARFSDGLAKHFRIIKAPAADSLRVCLTLTGASKTPPVVGTVPRSSMAGGLHNGVQYVRGGEGTLSGSVTYAVKVCDASSNMLLLARDVEQHPNSFNIGATNGSLTAAKRGIDTGADSLVQELTKCSAP